MSDNHARLFASAVPGNGSSNTFGENGSDDREANNIGQTGGVGRYTPELPDIRWDATSPIGEAGDDNEGNSDKDHGEWLSPDKPSAGGQGDIEEESIKHMDNIVESFRCNKITKLKALSKIISILDINPLRTEWAKDAAVEYYAKTLDEIQTLSSSAIRRGEVARGALESGGDHHKSTQPGGHINLDAKIDELISQLSWESKNLKKHSSGSASNDDGDLDGASNKRQRVFESEMLWFTREEEARRSGNKDCEESRRILHLFTRDYKVIKQ